MRLFIVYLAIFSHLKLGFVGGCCYMNISFIIVVVLIIPLVISVNEYLLLS